MLVLAVCLVQLNAAFAQQQPKTIKFIGADYLEFDKKLSGAQRAIGNVRFEYNGTNFRSDSAYIFANHDFDGFGHILIVKGSDYTLTGDMLHFNNAGKNAVMTNNVVLHDKQMTLTTNNLNYNVDTEVANYTGGGKIVSNKNKNVLTSKKGIYNTKADIFYFRDQVLLVNPEYKVQCDTLHYHNIKEIAYFFGPTTITGEKKSLYCENGWYNTKTEICQFNEHAVVTSDKTTLKGDSIYYDGTKEMGEVFRNVIIQDTSTNYIISGEYGRHLKKDKFTLVTGKAMLTQVVEKGDSLFMHADTLRAVGDENDKNTIFAFHHVKLFKKDMQGKCDSLMYFQNDSLLSMYGSPVLWNEQNQITGDTIEVRSHNDKMDNLLAKSNSFIISEALDGKYNQIKGKRMTGKFADNKMRSLYVEGNGQLIYFPSDDKKGKPKLVGHNKGECSNINIEINDNKIERIRMETAPNSLFSPMKLAKEDDFVLEGFKWRGAERPMTKWEIFIH
jgi:lipopolysaccharide export system protein LptA